MNCAIFSRLFLSLHTQAGVIVHRNILIVNVIILTLASCARLLPTCAYPSRLAHFDTQQTLQATSSFMYIIAIGWMYVVTLMAATETNFTAGLVTFIFYGAFPCSVLMYILGTKRRKQKRLAKEAAEQASQNDPEQPPL